MNVEHLCICGHGYEFHVRVDPRTGVRTGGACGKCRQPVCLYFVADRPVSLITEEATT